MANEPPQTKPRIILDENGKPCRTCNTLEDFQSATGRLFNNIKSATSLAIAGVALEKIPGSKTYYKEDPPDIRKLGASSWTFLHTMSAKYPQQPTPREKDDMKSFLNIFSRVYPCDWCAKDFEKYIRENAPKVESREELSRWMCEAHNSVNRKLNKEEFDCNFWQQRWKDGWDDPETK
ncbi:hypothetical protein TBLA_0G01160 [Henningerozyma blattae CBS 6284]|uniref:Sulfhydryl oxidase n=1 Tax=Henningerozyma blattae (strain ATCC 34711 / CBS 6284 / DSM 70876 / NBRC 10599 / NRRL Y-10934 / UCD 77-7) TaxID=1071380 RepID=I2H6R2_HENB6|nr:hypothetical protein TBLA_0G01160 [Tetrapisispora blattae CBS 6284]CCH62064.1 hypothetical protein TBLA_0G01160 [Tetrapisispora blattae CBS 6284]